MKPTVQNFDFSSVEVPDEVKKTVADMLFKQWIEEISGDETCNESNKAD